MKFESIESKANYGIGRQIGQQLKDSGMDDLDLQALQQGISDVISGKDPVIDISTLHEALSKMNEKAMAKKREAAQALAVEGEAFLTKNAQKEGVTVTPSGLQYEVITKGDGAIPTETNTVKVHYTGSLIDGTVFDSSVERGQPAEFPVNAVIKGWVEALQLMPVGSKWRLSIPYQLAYGEQGAGGAIPPFSTLIFDVELLDIVK